MGLVRLVYWVNAEYVKHYDVSICEQLSSTGPVYQSDFNGTRIRWSFRETEKSQWILMYCGRGHQVIHDGVIKWKHFPRYWPFVWGFHRSPVNSLHKGQWRGALIFPLICVWTNGWVNNRDAGDLRPYRAHYDVTVMTWSNVDMLSTRLKWKYSQWNFI